MSDQNTKSTHEEKPKNSGSVESVCADLSELSTIVNDSNSPKSEKTASEKISSHIDNPESSVCASLSLLSSGEYDSVNQDDQKKKDESLSLREDLSILSSPDEKGSKIQEQNENGSLDEPDAGESVCQDLETLASHRHGIAKGEKADPDLLKALKETTTSEINLEAFTRRKANEEIELLQNNTDIYLTHHPLLTGIIVIFGIGGLVTVFAISIPIGLIIISTTLLFHLFLRRVIDKVKHPIPMAVSGGVLLIMIIYLIIAGLVIPSFKTECCDGTYSSASGSGTCSHHGGIAANGCKAKYKRNK